MNKYFSVFGLLLLKHWAASKIFIGRTNVVLVVQDLGCTADVIGVRFDSSVVSWAFSSNRRILYLCSFLQGLLWYCFCHIFSPYTIILEIIVELWTIANNQETLYHNTAISTNLIMYFGFPNSSTITVTMLIQVVCFS